MLKNMLKIIVFFFLIGFSLCRAQTDTEYLFPTENINGFGSLYSNLVISGNSDVEIEGEISAEESITILPSRYYSISLKPKISNNQSSGQGDPDTGDGGTGSDDTLEGTGLKLKTKGSGGGTTSTMVIIITPSVVKQDITFSLSPLHNVFNRYRIYDMFGNLKLDQSIPNTNLYTADVSFLNTGNYLLVITTPDNVSLSKQFIKE